MKDDDEDLTLRDKFAIALLQGMMANNDFTNPTIDFINTHDAQDEDDPIKDSSTRIIRRRIRAAYKMADMMRKIRLDVFD